MDKVSEILQLCLYKRRPSSRTFDLAPSTDAPPPRGRRGPGGGAVAWARCTVSRAEPRANTSHISLHAKAHTTPQHIS